MKSIIILCGLLGAISALPIDEGVSLVQDNTGNYRLNYKTVDSAREEEGFDDGKVVGSYSYTDLNGTDHAIKYVADPKRGFLVEGNLPTQVAETPEVAAARAYHLAIVEQTRALLPELPEEEEEEEERVVVQRVIPRVAPAPVQAPAPAPTVVRNRPVAQEQSIKLITPDNIKLSPADLEALTAAIKSAKASNTPLENIKVIPSARRTPVRRVEKELARKEVEKKVEVDNTAEIEAAKAQLFAAHRAAIENLASEYRRIAKKRTQ